MSLLTVGSVDEFWDSSYSGFTYPSQKQLLELLDNDTSPDGNVVVQQPAFGYREATVAGNVPGVDNFELLRDYDETGDPINFTDYDGALRSVRVLQMTGSMVFHDVWSVTLRLQELSQPTFGS